MVRLQSSAFQTLRPAVSRKHRGFSVLFWPGSAVLPPRVLFFSKITRCSPGRLLLVSWCCRCRAHTRCMRCCRGVADGSCVPHAWRAGQAAAAERGLRAGCVAQCLKRLGALRRGRLLRSCLAGQLWPRQQEPCDRSGPCDRIQGGHTDARRSTGQGNSSPSGLRCFVTICIYSIELLLYFCAESTAKSPYGILS